MVLWLIQTFVSKLCAVDFQVIQETRDNPQWTISDGISFATQTQYSMKMLPYGHSIFLFPALFWRGRRQYTLEPFGLFVEVYRFPKQVCDSPDYKEKSQSECRQVYIAFTFVSAFVVVHPGIKVIKIGRRRRQRRSPAVLFLFDPGQNALVCEQTLCQREAETDGYEE